MYFDFYNLKSRPFAISPDPEFMLWTAQHEAAFQALQRQILTKAPLTLFSGEVGCGKSTLIFALLKSREIKAGCRVVHISSRLSSEKEAAQHILRSLDATSSSSSSEELMALACQSLSAVVLAGKMPVIIVDEAQTLSVEAALAMLNIVRGGVKGLEGISLILVGQPELSAFIEQPALADFRSHIDRRVSLGRLSMDEVAAFVHTRLQHAGYTGTKLFTPDAVEAIYEYSKGTPRLINKICDLALYCGAKRKQKTIDQGFIQEVLKQWNPPTGFQDELPKYEMADSANEALGVPSPKTTQSDPPKARKLDLDEGDNRAPQQGHRRQILEHVSVSDQPSPPDHEENGDRSWRKRVPNFVTGSLAAAACTVPVLLLLNFTDDWMNTGANVRSEQKDGTDQGGTTPVQSAENETFANLAPPADMPLVAAKESAQSPDPPDPDALRVAEVQKKLAALKREIAAAESAESRIAARLDRKRAELRSVVTALTDLTAKRDQAQTQLARSNAALQSIGRQIANQEIILAGLMKETAAAEIARSTLAAETATPGAELLNVDDVSRLALQPIGSSVLSLVDSAALAPEPFELSPLVADGEDPELFFSAALESANPAEVVTNFTRAAIRGHARSALYLGQLFDTGDGVRFDADMAKRWYEVAEDAGKLHDPVRVEAEIPAAVQRVSPVEAVVLQGTADFIWRGRSTTFTLELANQQQEVIAFAHTSLNAINIDLPNTAAFWRVMTDSGALFVWQPLPQAAQ